MSIGNRGAAAILLALLTLPAHAAPPGSPLALVPADAVGFAHIKAAEVWKSDLFAGFRASYEKAGPKAITALEQQLDPPPSALDSLTGFVLLTDREPLPFGIATFNRALNAEKFVKFYLPKASPKPVGGKTIYVDRLQAIYFPSDRQVMISTEEGLRSYLSQPVQSGGKLAATLELAEKRSLVLAGNIAALQLPAQVFEDVPPAILPLLKAQSLTLSVEVQGDPKVHFTAMYKDAAAAAEAEKAFGAAKEMAKGFITTSRAEVEKHLFEPKKPRTAEDYPFVVAAVLGLGSLTRLEETLDKLPIRKDGASLAFEVTIPKEIATLGDKYASLTFGLMVPTMLKARESAEEVMALNNLKQIMLAIHSYHDANGKLPENIKDKNGKPLLSWRVAILPYIEQSPIYDMFKLDEPWDSPANKKASSFLIKTYTSPSEKNPRTTDGYGVTNYVGVAGPNTAFDPKGGLKLFNFVDGLSNTIFLVETANAVPWAKPVDFDFDPKKELPNFLLPERDKFGAALGDGSVYALDPKIADVKELKKMFISNDGESVDFDRVLRPSRPRLVLPMKK